MDPLSERLARLSPDQLALLMQRLRSRAGNRARSAGMPRRAGTGPCAAFVRAAAAVVHPAAGARRAPPTTRYGPHGWTARWTRPPCSAPWTRWSRGTRRCAPCFVLRRRRAGAAGGGRDARAAGAWRTCAPLDRGADAEVRAARRAEQARPFDLAAGPLLRATLLRLAPERHVLLLSMHHVVSDGWSRGVIVREISARTRRWSRARSRELPALPVQYADYAVVAARAAAGRVSGRAAGVLARERWPARRRCWSCRRTTRARPCSRSPGASYRFRAAGRDRRRAARRWRGRRGHAVHDAAGRLQDAAGALHRAGGPGGGHARGQPRRGRRRRGWSASSSTRWRCARTCPATPPSARRCAACARRRWARTRTRTCRSSGWWRSCTRSAA